MKKLLIIISSIALLFSYLNSAGQQTGAWSALDTNSIIIGDQIKYEIGISLPHNTQVQWPLLVDTLTSNIEIINRSNIDTLVSEDKYSLSQQLIITSFDSGYFELPPVDFKFNFVNDSVIHNTSTGALFLQVYVPEVDTSQAFKPIIGPIKEPYTFAEILPWILLALAIIVITALVIVFIIRRRKKKPFFVKKPKPELPPHVKAIKELEELRLAKVWQTGKTKKYYTLLTDIIRDYIAGRYNFDAHEMTSFEILTELKSVKINDDAMSKIDSVLNLSDMVKFAKAIPTPLENDLSLSHCVDFVNETKPVIEDNVNNNKELTTKPVSK